jgi:hypothetical protein
VEVEFAVLGVELVLREIEGLVDQIVVFVFHRSEFVLLLIEPSKLRGLHTNGQM